MRLHRPPDSLHRLLKAKREALVSSWSKMIRASVSPGSPPVAELLDRVPAMVDEVIDVLGSNAPQRLATVGKGTGRLRHGFDVRQVVLEYGLLQDCVLRIAEEENVALTYHEQRVVAGWTSLGIAEALAEYVEEQDAAPRRRSSKRPRVVPRDRRRSAVSPDASSSRRRSR